MSKASKIRALFWRRDAAKRAWEAAKRSPQRGIAGPYYAELRAAEDAINAARGRA